MRNPLDFSRATSTLKPAAYSAATNNGTAVDCLGYRRALVVFNAGTADASAEADVKIQSSDASGSGFADITGATFAQVTTANDDTIYVAEIQTENHKRYLRAVATCDGTNAVTLSVEIVLMDPIDGPAEQLETVAFRK